MRQFLPASSPLAILCLCPTLLSAPGTHCPSLSLTLHMLSMVHVELGSGQQVSLPLTSKQHLSLAWDLPIRLGRLAGQ